MAKMLRPSTTRAGHMIVMMANGVEVMDPIITDVLATCSAIWWHTSMTRPFLLRPIRIQASRLSRTRLFFRVFPKGSTALRSLPL